MTEFRPLPLLALALCLAGCSDIGLRVSSEGRQRCAGQAPAAGAAAGAFPGGPLQGWLAQRRCLAGIEAQLAVERAAVRRQRQQRLEAATLRCREERERLRRDLASLEALVQEVSLVRAELYAPAKAPPTYDEAMEARFSQTDRNLDRERYDKELAAWSEQEVPRRRAWEAEHALRLERVQDRLDGLAASLRRRHPALFTTPTGIEVNEPVRQRLQGCRPADLASSLLLETPAAPAN
jgi:hypothetical protein